MKIIQKAAVGSMTGRLLLASTIAVTMLVIGSRVLADDAADIESFYPVGTTVSYDNTAGDYPVITAIVSQPGSFGGHTYSGWSVLAQDATGSLDLFVSQATLTNLTASAVTSFAVGDQLNLVGQWSPFHAEPELAFSTTPALANSITKVATGSAVPAPAIFAVNQLNTVAQASNNVAVSGVFIEITNVTITGTAGANGSVFPTFAQDAVANETYTMTDSTGSMTMFDFVSSDSSAAALAGTAVPTGPINMYGFMSVFPSAGLPGGGLPEFNIVSFEAVPEPSTVLLVGTGLLGLLAVRRRRS